MAYTEQESRFYRREAEPSSVRRFLEDQPSQFITELLQRTKVSSVSVSFADCTARYKRSDEGRTSGHVSFCCAK